jgi:hypothetical protein
MLHALKKKQWQQLVTLGRIEENIVAINVGAESQMMRYVEG